MYYTVQISHNVLTVSGNWCGFPGITASWLAGITAVWLAGITAVWLATCFLQSGLISMQWLAPERWWSPGKIKRELRARNNLSGEHGGGGRWLVHAWLLCVRACVCVSVSYTFQNRSLHLLILSQQKGPIHILYSSFSIFCFSENDICLRPLP